jgi:hypothetical protein
MVPPARRKFNTFSRINGTTGPELVHFERGELLRPRAAAEIVAVTFYPENHKKIASDA